MENQSENASLKLEGSHNEKLMPQASPAPSSNEQNIQRTIFLRKSRGALRMEGVYRVTTTKRSRSYLVAAAILLYAWAFTFSSMSVSLYAVQASSYFQQQGSVLAIVSIITSVAGATAKPFFARIADHVSRQFTYIVVSALYAVGYVLAASSVNAAMLIAGSVLASVADAGLLIANDIVVADLTPLQWRGYASAMLAIPYLVNFWFVGKIVDAMDGDWRWGYGMFAALMPVSLAMSTAVIWKVDALAQKSACDRTTRTEQDRTKDICGNPTAFQSFFELGDIFLIGFGLAWCLILLPFSLVVYFDQGWRSSPIIALLVLGSLLLIVLAASRRMLHLHSSRRLFSNRTFVIVVVMQSVYMVASNIRGLYWSSYVLIAKPWTLQNWTYYTNIPLLSSTIAGVLAGLLQRVLHRYKALLVFGLLLKLIGMGILLNADRVTQEDWALIVGVLLCGIADAMESVCCRVAAQASVSHDDVAHALATYALWPKIANAVGAAIVGTIWAQCLLPELQFDLPPGTSQAEVLKIYNSPTYIRSLEGDVRTDAISAYRRVLFYCVVAAMSLSAIPLVAVWFVSDFFLGKQQNAVDGVGNDGSPQSTAPATFVPEGETKRTIERPEG